MEGGCTISTLCESISGSENPRKRSRVELSTPESVVLTRKRICKDKSRTYKNNTPTMISSKMLDLDSTSKGQVYAPFWTESSRDWSRKLWLPTKIASVDMESKSWNSSLKNLALNSWFTVTQKQFQKPENWQMTSLPLPRSLWHDITEEGPKRTEEKENNLSIITKKIRLYPSRHQKKKLQSWFGVVRWTYNRCVAALKNNLVQPTKKALRAFTVNDNSLNEFPWAKEVPYDIRDESGMTDVLKAIGSNKAKIQKGTLKKFDLAFRSAKAPQQSIVVQKKHWKHKKGKYSDVFGASVLKSSEKLPENLQHDSRLVKDNLGHYYLCLCIPSMESENQAPASRLHNTISLDPGCRTFMSGYDADGTLIEWGKGDMGRIHRLCAHLDKLQSRCGQVNHSKRYRLRRASKRLREKVKNLVREVHKKCSTWLCRNYRRILIPIFEVANMVQRKKRKINSKVVRSLLTWSHYKFRERLIHKAKEHAWCKVVVTEEPYTSKTCTNCGWVDKKLGSKKDFTCQECRVIIDRDSNGARNILIRYLTLKNKK
jgi:putative transposase